MKPEFFCCIGAELKDEIAGSLKSSRIFMYRAAESQTIADMLADGFFNDADDLRVNDLILLYCPEQDRSNTFAKVSSISGGLVKTTKLTIDPEDAEVFENTYVKKSGDTMTGVLKFRASESFQCAVAPYWDGVGFFKLNDNDSVTLIASLEYQDSFAPAENNVYNIGSTSKKWKNLYLAGKAYMSVINNGFDIAVPVTNSADTLALKSQVDLAANSGSQLYTTGVWYAKMYSASTVPTGAEYDGKNYADFSQVDNDNKPIIVIYEGQSGAWVEIERITPPSEYNGYITVTSKIWDIAEQTDQQGGEVLWSYNQKTFTPYPKIVSLLNQANTDLDNLTATGKNIANWSNNVTNCITEIPQDINLTLSDGTLTLKAGSKVYVPNGAGMFDVVAFRGDKAATNGWGGANVEQLVFVRGDNLHIFPKDYCFSGATAPTSFFGSNFATWYDTTNNIIKFTQDAGSTWESGLSLPFGIIKETTGDVINSIDQVFNGFGYIGSTVFVLPGVKALVPNYRNADGTLKNTLITKQSVNVFTPSSATFSQVTNIALGNNLSYHTFTYDAVNNKTSAPGYMNAGDITWTNGKITYFNPKTAFHAVDYNDFQKTITQIEMPTGTIISYAGITVPSGFLVCDGSAISRTVYANLFSAIGTTYGSGDGSTTFNLPNVTIPSSAYASVVTNNEQFTWSDDGHNPEFMVIDTPSTGFCPKTAAANDIGMRWGSESGLKADLANAKLSGIKTIIKY